MGRSDLLTARFRVRIPGPEPIVNSKLTPPPTRALARTSFVHPLYIHSGHHLLSCFRGLSAPKWIQPLDNASQATVSTGAEAESNPELLGLGAMLHVWSSWA